MASTSEVDNDTLAAVRSAWLLDTSELPTLLAEPPIAGRLKGNRPDYPYAAIECAQGPVPNERSTGNVRQDFRQVTMTVWGTKPQVSAALNALLDRFNSGTYLAYPSGDRFVQWWPLNDGDLSEDPDTALGQDIWKGTLKAKIWSVRHDSFATALGTLGVQPTGTQGLTGTFADDFGTFPSTGSGT